MHNSTRGVLWVSWNDVRFAVNQDGVLRLEGAPYISPRLDGPWWSIRKERERQEFKVESKTYNCNISKEFISH